MVILAVNTLLIGLPLVYMETFLGRYTKLTNCQMYRMCPIFFGKNWVQATLECTWTDQTFSRTELCDFCLQPILPADKSG